MAFGSTRISRDVANVHIRCWPEDESDRLAWCEWLKRHGFTPEDVPADCRVICDDDRRTVTCDVFQRDSAGGLVIVGDEAARTTRTVQLEAPALPMPGEPPAGGGA